MPFLRASCAGYRTQETIIAGPGFTETIITNAPGPAVYTAPPPAYYPPPMPYAPVQETVGEQSGSPARRAWDLTAACCPAARCPQSVSHGACSSHVPMPAVIENGYNPGFGYGMGGGFAAGMVTGMVVEDVFGRRW